MLRDELVSTGLLETGSDDATCGTAPEGRSKGLPRNALGVGAFHLVLLGDNMPTDVWQRLH